ncbi:ArsA family ATPase [Sandaracinus amylolyticus]|uniref:ArsA family ATPase n=1 Tax=Sandaracinus amylolyticus TaxID=927083 RepID=UPI00069FBA6E|nr:ArsA-related P-loop ATPase [Sandaracinus amylolyticus]
MASAPSDTLSPRGALPPLGAVVLVTGKGGVGKTTLAAGIAEAAAAREGRAVLIEFGDGESGKRVLGPRSKVAHRVVDPRDAMERAVANILGSTILARLFIGNFAVRPMLRAAPAMRELAMLEVVRIYAEEHPGARVVVDMPATGHGLAWLRLPVQMRDMFASGPIHDLAQRLIDRLVSPSRCSVVVVTLPERLVLSETIELCRALEVEVGLPPARLVVNRFPRDLPAEAWDSARAIAARGGESAPAAQQLLRMLDARREAQREALEILGSAVKTSLHTRPLILREQMEDPSATDVAAWLTSEGAA